MVQGLLTRSSRSPDRASNTIRRPPGANHERAVSEGLNDGSRDGRPGRLLSGGSEKPRQSRHRRSSRRSFTPQGSAGGLTPARPFVCARLWWICVPGRVQSAGRHWRQCHAAPRFADRRWRLRPFPLAGNATSAPTLARESLRPRSVVVLESARSTAAGTSADPRMARPVSKATRDPAAASSSSPHAATASWPSR